jgi:hypothetical protein
MLCFIFLFSFFQLIWIFFLGNICNILYMLFKHQYKHPYKLLQAYKIIHRSLRLNILFNKRPADRLPDAWLPEASVSLANVSGRVPDTLLRGPCAASSSAYIADAEGRLPDMLLRLPPVAPVKY